MLIIRSHPPAIPSTRFTFFPEITQLLLECIYLAISPIFLSVSGLCCDITGPLGVIPAAKLPPDLHSVTKSPILSISPLVFRLPEERVCEQYQRPMRGDFLVPNQPLPYFPSPLTLSLCGLCSCGGYINSWSGVILFFRITANPVWHHYLFSPTFSWTLSCFFLFIWFQPHVGATSVGRPG